MKTEIIVALIAAFVSFIGLVISKEQKISEFRQNWIDKFREDVSDLLGAINLIIESWITANRPGIQGKKVEDDFIKERSGDIRHINVLIARCKLRLNPEKDTNLIDKLSELKYISINPKMLSGNNCNILLEDVESMTHALFKQEWERVKEGEKTFRFVKNILFITIIISILLTISWFGLNIYIKKNLQL
jgi:hypothetical protein